MANAPSLLSGDFLQHPDNAGKWSEDSKAMALWIYAETGSIQTASCDTSIPPSTIHTWLQEEGAQATLDILRSAIRAHIAHRALVVGIEGLKCAIEGLRRGDAHVDRYGNVTYVPVKSKDAMFVASMAIDKAALLTGIAGQTANQTNALASLASKLVDAIGAMAGAAQAPSTPLPVTPLGGELG